MKAMWTVENVFRNPNYRSLRIGSKGVSPRTVRLPGMTFRLIPGKKASVSLQNVKDNKEWYKKMIECGTLAIFDDKGRPVKDIVDVPTIPVPEPPAPKEVSAEDEDTEDEVEDEDTEDVDDESKSSEGTSTTGKKKRGRRSKKKED